LLAITLFRLDEGPKRLITLPGFSKDEMAPPLTTTIGSLFRFKDDLRESIGEAIKFQLGHRLDILSDGEQRTDMVSYFAESFNGLGIEGGAPMVTGKVGLANSAESFSKVQDLIFIRSMFPDLKIKVAITGPTTLGMTCGSRKIKSHYRSIMDFALYEDLAGALAPIARALTDRGAYVQLDEPFLSQGFKDIADRVKILDFIAEGLPREMVSVHACGPVGKVGVIDHLVKLDNVSVLSFAFAGKVERSNSDHVSKKAFEDNGKKLGVGCISVTPMKAEDVDTPQAVAAKLKEMSTKVGRENIAYVHPDCGMRATNKSMVPIILKNMRAGVDLFG